MTYSTQRATSDGSLVLLDLSLEYFDRSEIAVLFDGVLSAVGWAWVGSTEHKLSFTPAVPSGVEVTVLRSTDIASVRHNYSGGAAFTYKTIDENMLQVLHIAQEARENAKLEDIFSDLNVHGYGIHNIANGVAMGDAVNVGQLAIHDSTILGYVAQCAASALAAANSAIAAASSALGVLGQFAASTGASLIGFIQSGTGSVSRTAQDKLRELVSVKDFGAVGGGVTSDQSAFESALALGVPVLVPYTPDFYKLTGLTDTQLALLWGPGVVKVSGVIYPISSVPTWPSTALAGVTIVKPNLQPDKWSSVEGSLRNGAASINVTRKGGYGSYGLTLTEYLVDTTVPLGQFDVGLTEWVSATNLAGGQVFGGWDGANTPNSELGQVFTSGAAIGREINVGNRWAEFGLLTDIGAPRYTAGLQLAPDVAPAKDGAYTSVFHGSFAAVIAPSVHGHKWWVGTLIRENSIVPGGHVHLAHGGSGVPNATGSYLKADGFWTRGLDFSGATISTQAILFGSGHAISWGGSSMSATATTMALSTGAGTGYGTLFANNFTQAPLYWGSDGTNPLIGFFGVAPQAKPTITGSRGANAALGDLLTKLAGLGLITNSTS